MINWNKYFDHIFCIHYLDKNRLVRHNNLVNELKRVGIYNSGIFSFIYDYNCDIMNEMFNNVRNFEWNYNGKMINHYGKRTTINHLLAYVNSYYLGYKKILVLEDDIAFLKNIDEIETILEKYKDNKSELVLYDYIKGFGDMVDETVPSANYFYASCYSLTENGMAKMINNIQGQHFNVIDEYWCTRSSMKLYDKISGAVKEITIDYVLTIDCSDKRLCIQCNDIGYDIYGKLNNVNKDEYNQYPLK